MTAKKTGNAVRCVAGWLTSARRVLRARKHGLVQAAAAAGFVYGVGLVYVPAGWTAFGVTVFWLSALAEKTAESDVSKSRGVE